MSPAKAGISQVFRAADRYNRGRRRKSGGEDQAALAAMQGESASDVEQVRHRFRRIGQRKGGFRVLRWCSQVILLKSGVVVSERLTAHIIYVYLIAGLPYIHGLEG